MNRETTVKIIADILKDDTPTLGNYHYDRFYDDDKKERVYILTYKNDTNLKIGDVPALKKNSKTYWVVVDVIKRKGEKVEVHIKGAHPYFGGLW